MGKTWFDRVLGWVKPNSYKSRGWVWYFRNLPLTVLYSKITKLPLIKINYKTLASCLHHTILLLPPAVPSFVSATLSSSAQHTTPAIAIHAHCPVYELIFKTLGNTKVINLVYPSKAHNTITTGLEHCYVWAVLYIIRGVNSSQGDVSIWWSFTYEPRK